MSRLERVAAALGGTLLLVAGGVISLVVDSVPLGYIAVGCLGVVVAYLAVSTIVRLRRELEETRLGYRDDRVGLEAVYDNPAEARADLYGEIAAAEQQVVLIGISHRSLLADDSFLEALDKFLAKRDAHLVVMFTRPDGSVIGKRATDEGETPETFIADVEANLGRFNAWVAREKYEANVKIMYYDEYPDWRIELVDGRLLFVSYYPVGATGQHSMVLRLGETDVPGSLFDAFKGAAFRLQREARSHPSITVVSPPEGSS